MTRLHTHRNRVSNVNLSVTIVLALALIYPPHPPLVAAWVPTTTSTTLFSNSYNDNNIRKPCIIRTTCPRYPFLQQTVAAAAAAAAVQQQNQRSLVIRCCLQ